MQYESLIYSGLLEKITATSNVSNTTKSKATVIDLTQVACQFLETEAKDYQY